MISQTQKDIINRKRETNETLAPASTGFRFSPVDPAPTDKGKLKEKK
jgi:hypothetical protein